GSFCLALTVLETFVSSLCVFCSKGKTFSHYFPIFGKTFKTEVKRYKNTVAKLLLKINGLCGNLIQNSMLWFYSSYPSASPVGVTKIRNRSDSIADFYIPAL
ncbi:MAG: hypothetical protein IJL22_08120, partial [Bacteroidales bacterium]|nr:hypothetical protein [Bacteroidales bacterium]